MKTLHDAIELHENIWQQIDLDRYMGNTPPDKELLDAFHKLDLSITILNAVSLLSTTANEVHNVLTAAKELREVLEIPELQ